VNRVKKDQDQAAAPITCGNQAVYRYTWPGQREALCCQGCADRLLNVATAMGFNLQFVELSVVEAQARTCSQVISKGG